MPVSSAALADLMRGVMVVEKNGFPIVGCGTEIRWVQRVEPTKDALLIASVANLTFQ